MRIVIKRTQRDVQAVTLRGEVIELRDKLNPWADRFKQPGRQQYEPDTGKGSGDHGGVGEHGMAESDTVPNWGDLGPSRKARTLHPIGGAEGQRMGVEESELVIVCAGQRESRVGSSPTGARMQGAISKHGGNASWAARLAVRRAGCRS